MIVKWGVIGCGAVADYKGGPALYNVKGSELVAVMGRDVNKAKAFAERHGAKRYYGTVEGLLRDEDVNAVYVATPPSTHCQYTIQAAEAGKHVLCEKPMAVNLTECRKMIDVCKKHNVKLMVAYYRRGYPNVQKIKQLIEQGYIGEVVLARVSSTGYYNPENTEDPTNWRTNPQIAGGGVLMDIGCHYIDLLIYLLGEITDIKALIETIHCRYAVEDSAELILKFKRGPHGIANFNWNVGIDTMDFGIYGTQGKISFNPGGIDRSGDLTLQTKENGFQVMHLEPLRITHLGIVKDFVGSLAQNKNSLCPGEEGIKTNEAIEVAYRSSHTAK